jgi:hypothetical protein
LICPENLLNFVKKSKEAEAEVLEKPQVFGVFFLYLFLQVVYTHLGVLL